MSQQHTVHSCNMVWKFSFRVLYRVVFLCFCISLTCFYHHGGESRNKRKFRNGNCFKDKDFPQQAKYASPLKENAEQMDSGEPLKKTDVSKTFVKENAGQIDSGNPLQKTDPSKTVGKEILKKAIQRNRIRKRPTTLVFTESKESTTTQKRLKNSMFYQGDLSETARRKMQASFTSQHLRSKRELNPMKSATGRTECSNFTFTIKYEDEYNVWTNFSIKYQGRMYHYYQYRVTDDGLQVCNSSQFLIRQKWREFTAREKLSMPSKQCNVSVDGFFFQNYTIYKNLTVFLKYTQQSFKRGDYGVYFGHFTICSSKHNLSCDNFLIKVKNNEQFSVSKNFNLFYNSRIYDYREYRFSHDSLQLCASSDQRVQTIWKTRNSWEKFKHVHQCRMKRRLNVQFYTLSKQFTVYFADSGQFYPKQNYAVINGMVIVCQKDMSAPTTEYTHEDLSMCNDSIINIKYNEEYEVWKNFSIFYKNKVYDYTEYRALNDVIKICNSTDVYIRNIWKVRNYWIKATMHLKSCSEPNNLTKHYKQYYGVEKQFTVYFSILGQHFTRNDYGVKDGKLIICREKLRPESTEYTQEDLSMCNDSIINIKYDNEYKVRDDFSIFYKKKVYKYNEYRVLNDSIKICNSTDYFVRNFWRLRNEWVKAQRHFKSCMKPIDERTIHKGSYTVLKDFTVVLLPSLQVVTKKDYGVFEGKLIMCFEKILYSTVRDINFFIAPLTALALSFVCSLLLLIVYGILPELRTLPGLNLMSLTLALLSWQINQIVYFSRFMRLGTVYKVPCARIITASKFTLYSILMNVAVSIYHLKKTFCGKTLVKSDENKWKTFFKYSLFSWGAPVVITIVYAVLLVKENIFRLEQDRINGLCIAYLPTWSVTLDQLGLPFGILFCIIVMFSHTAYRIRQKLKASSSITQKSNIVKRRKGFVILLKLSTTAFISCTPLIYEGLQFSYHTRMALFTITWLSGVYVGIAFVFTKQNYRLLKKKYFPVKK